MPDGGRDGIRLDGLSERELAGEHRQVLQRQLLGPADRNGVAAGLHRELRSPDHGRADALARVPDRRQVTPVGERMRKRACQVLTEVTEAAVLTLVEIFRNAA